MSLVKKTGPIVFHSPIGLLAIDGERIEAVTETDNGYCMVLTSSDSYVVRDNFEQLFNKVWIEQ